MNNTVAEDVHNEADPAIAAGPIVVFDAMCVLCAANACFILRWDRAQTFRLASMQQPAGAALYRRWGIDPANPETMIIVDGNRLYRDSDAVLKIFETVSWPWRALAVFRLLPAALRDPVYRWIARHRYRIFGRRQSCWVPSPADRHRVL